MIIELESGEQKVCSVDIFSIDIDVGGSAYIQKRVLVIWWIIKCDENQRFKVVLSVEGIIKLY